MKTSILIIEDDPWVAEYMADVVRTLLSMTVLTATSPQEARQVWAASRESICLVVCDLSLPGMRGEKLVAELLRDRADIPVVFATGHVEDEEDLSAAVGRPVSVLCKPFRPDELVALLETRLNGIGQTAQAVN